MNGNKILLDTNIIIYILSWNEEYINKFSTFSIFTSFISELEVLSYNFTSIEDENNAKYFFENVEVLQINQDIKNIVISIRKSYKIKLPDCIIIATAIFHNLEFESNDLKLLEIYRKFLRL